MSTITLSLEQQAVVNEALTGNSNIACIAAAGSGKTTMLTHLVNRIVKESTITPALKKKRVLVLAFNKSAADDFCEKLVALDPALFARKEMTLRNGKVIINAKEDVARTFDSWLPELDGREWFSKEDGGCCLDFNRRKREEVWTRAMADERVNVDALFDDSTWGKDDEDEDEGEEDELDLTTSGRLWRLWNRCWREHGVLPSTLERPLCSMPPGFRPGGFMTDARRSAEESKRWSGIRQVFKAFERLCGDRGLWTMGHVYLSLHKTVRAGGVPLQRLRAQVAVRYDFIVVDEAQDNNRMQNVIVQALCRAEGRGGPRLLMVGDPRQCIYEWRGASPEQLVEFAALSSTRRLDLTVNRRSLPHIVKRADDVIRFAKYGPDSQALREGDGVLREGETRGSMVQMCVRLARLGKPLGIMMLSYANAAKRDISAELLAREVPHTVDGEAPGYKDVEYAAKRVGSGSVRDVAARTRHAAWSVRRRRRAAPILVALLEKAQANEWDGEQLLAWYDTYQTLCLKADFNLSTIHKAKGLEQDIVIVRNPTLRDPASETSARMMYVAMTRAKNHLFVFDVPEDAPEVSAAAQRGRPHGVTMTNVNFLD